MVLPRSARMTSSADFQSAVRSGVRAGRPTVVVHARSAPGSPQSVPEDVRVGFVVSRAVGGAVVRNRVKRRLRHLARQRLVELPRGLRLVVRALPPAAGAEALAADLDWAWARAVSRATS